MAESDVETVRAAFRAYAARDLDALLALADPEVEIRSLMTEAEREVYRGHDGLRDWFRAVFEVFPDWHPVPSELRDIGGAVLTGFHVTATAAVSGVRIERAFWQASTLRDGRITWFGFFRTEADALAALGAAR